MTHSAKSVTFHVKIRGLDALGALVNLERLGVVTADPARAAECCGIPRDDQGRCVHRPGHPIYVGPVSVAPVDGPDQGENSLGEEQCCYLACDGGACELCPCCCAGWCVFGQDGQPEPGSEDEARWLEIRTLTAQGGFR